MPFLHFLMHCAGQKPIEVFNVHNGRKLREFHLDQASEMIHFEAGVMHGTKASIPAARHSIHQA